MSYARRCHRWAALAVACGCVLGARPSCADETPPAEPGWGDDSTPAPEVAVPAHRFGVYVRSGAAAYFTAARSAGGAGGGIGLRDVVDGWLVLQADAAYLFGVGNLAEIRAGAGAQLPGPDRTYQPAATLLLSLYAGEQIRFLSEEHPTPVWDPGVAVGVELAPLRFTGETSRVSLLAPGIGVGLDFPSVGPVFQVTALEVELALR